MKRLQLIGKIGDVFAIEYEIDRKVAIIEVEVAGEFIDGEIDIAAMQKLRDWLNTALEAPQVESEPVAYRWKSTHDFHYVDSTDEIPPPSQARVIQPLFLKPQASVTVLPEEGIEGPSYAQALADVSELNATPVPIELLRRICKFIKCEADYDDYEAALSELRELIK